MGQTHVDANKGATGTQCVDPVTDLGICEKTHPGRHFGTRPTLFASAPVSHPWARWSTFLQTGMSLTSGFTLDEVPETSDVPICHPPRHEDHRNPGISNYVIL